MPQQFKNIIFDLGGVLLNIDYERPVKAFARLGVENFEQQYSQNTINPIFKQLENGYIGNDHFLQAMAALIPQPVSHQQIIEAWNSIILGFRLSSMAYLDTLQPHYRLFLLSNTNAIHYEQIQSFYRQETGRDSLDDCFEKAWYSHKVGMRKPGKEVYAFALEDAGLRPEETLFIDDSEQNIAPAEELGIQTYLLPPNQLIETLGLI